MYVDVCECMFRCVYVCVDVCEWVKICLNECVSVWGGWIYVNVCGCV